MKRPGDRYTVPALARAFEILDMLAMSSVGLTKMDIARHLLIPYSTAFNLLSTLEQYGYVRKDENAGKYHLGLKSLSFGNIGIRDGGGLRDVAAPVLEDLVRKTGLTAHLAILDRGEAVYIDKKEPDGFLKINSWIGKRNYVHTSAVGKALVAAEDPETVCRIWESGLPRRTANTIGSWKRFAAELAAVRKRGYAVDKEEDELGGRCVAAAVIDSKSAAVAAIGLSGIVSQVPDERIPVLGAMLHSAAAEVSSRLGFRRPAAAADVSHLSEARTGRRS